MTFESVVVEYFPIQGRLEPIKYAVEDLSIAYTEVKGVDHFRANKMDCEQYFFNQLPRVIVDGEILAQQDAILRFFTASAGNGPSGDLKVDLRANMLGCSVEDLARAYLIAIKSPEHATDLVTFANEQAFKVFTQYESLLKSSPSKSGYFAYDYPSFAEYHLLSILRAIVVLKPTVLAPFPLLSVWHETMISRKGIAAYLASGRQIEKISGAGTGQKALC